LLKKRHMIFERSPGNITICWFVSTSCNYMTRVNRLVLIDSCSCNRYGAC